MNNHPKWYRLGVLIIVLVFILTVICIIRRSDDLPRGLSTKWQAVFLTDGQVYFGKLENYNSRYISLRNVYYLKFAEGLQQEKVASGVQSLSSRNLNLIKLGGEAHGPEGDMFIAKDKILFFENLKDNSTVVQAILNNSK